MRLLLLSLVLLLSPSTVSAQDDLAVLLARAYVAEGGWNAADHAGIYWSIRNRSAERGVTFLVQLSAYARGLYSRTRRGEWIRGLDEDLHEPPGWPEAYRWDRFRRAWAETLTRSRTDLVIPPPNPCDGRPEHWGGMTISRDRDRAERAVREGRWRRLRCGDARNAFFEVRRRLRRAEGLARVDLPARPSDTLPGAQVGGGSRISARTSTASARSETATARRMTSRRRSSVDISLPGFRPAAFSTLSAVRRA